MTARKSSTPTLEIVNALDALMGAVRKNHPEVPDNIVIAIASGRSRRGQKHGHFAPESWKDGGHEILLSGESFQRGAEATLGTLIHELAHATAHVTEVRDTSNNGRYHNKKFKSIAEGLGITLEEAPTIGWSVTTLPPETAAKYRTGLDKLEKALVTYRVGGSSEEPKKPRKSTKLTVDCACEDPFSISIQRFERHPMTCDDCLEPIVPVEV